MIFHRSLSDRKSQVSRTLLNILANICNSVVRMLSASPLISNFSSTITKSLGIVPSTPIIISITVTFMFYNFCLVLRKCPSSCLSFPFLNYYSLLSYIMPSTISIYFVPFASFLKRKQRFKKSSVDEKGNILLYTCL